MARFALTQAMLKFGCSRIRPSQDLTRFFQSSSVGEAYTKCPLRPLVAWSCLEGLVMNGMASSYLPAEQ